MIGSILLGLAVWFLLSIPVGIMVGKLLARASRATMPLAPSSSMVETNPTRPVPLGEQMGYMAPISRISHD
jgi:hypothetical protein